MSMYSYQGKELEGFALATNWKQYLRNTILPELRGGAVLEVGAGIGGTTEMLCDGAQERWICLEPDRELASIIQKKIAEGVLRPCCRCVTGTIQDIHLSSSLSLRFDAILYIDTLEHIADDKKEIQNAVDLLDVRGRLIVLAPAHQFLWSPFDKAVGHFRRYNVESLAGLIPGEMALVRLCYMDAVGMLASIANKYVLKRQNPKQAEIDLWDRWMVPISRRIDPLMGYKFGKSVLGIWRKRAD